MDGKDLQPPVEQRFLNPEVSPNKLGLRFFEAQISKSGNRDKNSPDNEDTVRASTVDSFVIVCDGMGGLRNGKIASETAASEVEKALKWVPDNDPQYFQQLEKALVGASQTVRTRFPQGGTTATVAKIIEINGQRKLRVASVGNSRAYLVRGQDGMVIQITEDDSLVNLEEKDPNKRLSVNDKLNRVRSAQDYARLSPQERSWFDRRNQITQYLGSPNIIKPHFYEYDLGDDDLVVLVTDGVSDNLGDQIATPLQNPNIPTSRKAQLLVDGAFNYSKVQGDPNYRRASIDDCSAVIIDVGEKIPDKKYYIQQVATFASLQDKAEALQRLTQVLNKAASDPQLEYGESRVIAESMSNFFRAAEKAGFREYARQDRPEDKARRAAMEVILKKANLAARIDRFYQAGKSEKDFYGVAGSQTTETPAYFFVTGSLPEVYPDNDPNTQKAIDQYNSPENKRQLIKRLKALPNISGNGQVDTYWTEISSKSMPQLGHAVGDIGRIYLNIKPEMQVQVFAQLATFLNNSPQVEFGAKMITPGHMDVNGLRRGDSTVLYFSAKDQQRVLDVVRSLYASFGPNAFEQISPIFAAILKDESGTLMRGISFGQDPEGIKASFNKVRRGVLENLKPLYGTPEFEYQFQRFLHSSNVDYSNPAFNWPPERGRKLFSVIVANSI